MHKHVRLCCDLRCVSLPGRLLARKDALQKQLQHLQAAADSEVKVQQQYDEVVAAFMHDRGARTKEAQASLDKVNHAGGGSAASPPAF